MFKRAFLAAIAVMMLVPALAMAQTSTVVFYTVLTSFNDDEELLPEVEGTVSCNAGSPLQQSAMVGGIDIFELEGSGVGGAIAFSVSEVPGDFPTECTISFGDLPDGWMVATTLYGPSDDFDFISGGDWLDPPHQDCTFARDGGEIDSGVAPLWDENVCLLWIIPEPVDFEVTVDWSSTPDADPGVGAETTVDLICYNVWFFGLSYTISTNLLAGPDVEMPIALTSFSPQPDGSTYCVAQFASVSTAIDTDDSTCSFFYETEVEVELGDEPSCTISATAWYEGIPTLSQYGMAIMALLMLGVGFMAFRRFA